MRTDPDGSAARDVHEFGDLVCNGDSASFYRDVAAYMAKLSGEGIRFTFDDTRKPLHRRVA